jgi:RimJ/RimL family protein N-acetyltransferase
MLCLCRWPAAERLETVGLILEPLRIEHAEEMVLVLGDRRLYAYTGGEPPDLDRLRARFARQIVGRSSDGEHGWLNWIVRVRSTWEAAGVVQARLSDEDRHVEAEIAWIVGVAQQGNGYATEAAVAMVGWLARHGVAMLVAHIHPGHAASIGVARRLGLSPTEVSVDGETRWIGPAALSSASGDAE